MKFLILLSLTFLLQNGFSQNLIDLDDLPDVADMIHVRTNPLADTIIIGMHGGPSGYISPGDFFNFEQIPTFSVVEVEQYQHYFDIGNRTDMTSDEGIMINDSTVAMMKKVVDYFNDEGRVVVLAGHSFGAFLLMEYLDDYGFDGLHRLAFLSGRLNMNNEIINSIDEYYFAGFSDGIEIVYSEEKASEEDWPYMKLMVGIGYNRFVDSLEIEDLSKAIFVYATADNAVGSLLPDELQLIEKNNGSILKIENGDHGDSLQKDAIASVVQFIRGDEATSLLAIHQDSDLMNLYPTAVDEYVNVDVKHDGVLKIYNVQGRLVKQVDCTQGVQKVSVAELGKGFYFSRFSDGKLVSKSLKFVVQ